ncbi:MAG TPA: 3-oxoacyl-ACP reductase [Actinomycetaceae bacterium]|nr:3-oxoacyl-ACP reductase [Actinomycetaceae bacterium]
MDKYIDLVSGGLGKKLARQLGLPTPVALRRHSPGDPLLEGPVLVLSDYASRDDADRLAAAMLSWHLDVRRSTHLPQPERWGAVVVVLTNANHPDSLADPALELGSTLRQLARNGRVVFLSRQASAADSPDVAAARAGVEGVMRSLGKELRAGATANGIVLCDGDGAGSAGLAGVTSPSVLGTLRFLFSGRSAFVDGQPIPVVGNGEEDPSWERPLEGLVAVVTGAARGIGTSIVEVLTRDGAQVIGVDVPAAGESLMQVMNEVKGMALQLDVTAPGAADRILGAARERYGRLDIVIHNAGILRDKLLANMTEDRWKDLIAVNITAPLAMSARFVEAAEAGLMGDSPRIVSLASTSGIAGNRGQTNYAAAKSGIIGMTEALAGPIGAVGGAATAVAPGFIETDMTARIPALMRQFARRANSLQQGGLPIDVAETIAFLASPAAGGINGAVVRVCGQNLVGR